MKMINFFNYECSMFIIRSLLAKIVVLFTITSSQADEIIDKSYHILVPDFEDTFDIPSPPADSSNKKIKLWSTNYHTHQPNPDKNGVPFRDKNGVAISDKVTKKGWCRGAEEGAVKTTFKGKVVMLTHAGRLKKEPSYAVDCAAIFNKPGLKYKKIYHELTNTPYGFGQNDWFLVPYRTLAVQTSGEGAVLGLKLGDVIFIKELKGTPVYDSVTEKTYKHDGYLFVGDRGSEEDIKGTHVDTFCGFLADCMSSFTGSNDNYKAWFDAQIITDLAIKEKLKRMHLQSSYR